MAIDRDRRAVLAMDFQHDIVAGFVPTDGSLLERTARLFGAARRAAIPVIYVVMNVVADCCADRDEEVHRVLTQKVFATMAPPLTAGQFIAAVG